MTSLTPANKPDQPPATATILGYPRLGRRRELKRLLESHWAGDCSAEDVRVGATKLRTETLMHLAALGLDQVPSNIASLYDHVLDAAVLVNAVPARFRALIDDDPDRMTLKFAMARGTADAPPLELTKWFDTNYHFLTPEIDTQTPFALLDDQPVRQFNEARNIAPTARPVLVGPVTFLALSKPAEGAPDGFTPLDRIDELAKIYAELLQDLADHGVADVQLDEPILVTDVDDATAAALKQAYGRLGALERRPQLTVATYFGDATDHLDVLIGAGVETITVDLTATNPDDVAAVEGIDQTTVIAGVVDGRNVWRTDPDAALAKLKVIKQAAGRLVVAPSCSLLHVPHDLEGESALDPRLKRWLSFADEKIAEVVALTQALNGHEPGELAEARAAVADRQSATWTRHESVRQRVAQLPEDATERADVDVRRDAQRNLELPPLPTTTIGSFPQTDEVRKARADHRAGRIDDNAYEAAMHGEIARVIALQERVGLDVLVHGEPERNDMVQYFAEAFAGFATTQFGWVQSYGTRAVRPPILFGDVHRPQPVTVPWFNTAQALTSKHVKGMLTGPVTILAWSFVRDDQPLGATAEQVALAVRDEVTDLETAGARIIQVDEPALRELLPLNTADQPDYLDWSVRAFRLATSGAAPATQIHTHLCYSEFAEVLDAISALGADVTSIEAARSRMEVVDALAAQGFERGVGPGVYDIHSPRVPTVSELEMLLQTASASVPANLLWANPDCGLKTRGYIEVEPALRNLVTATQRVRDSLT